MAEEGLQFAYCVDLNVNTLLELPNFRLIVTCLRVPKLVKTIQMCSTPAVQVFTLTIHLL